MIGRQDWLEIARTAVRCQSERKIVRDSDGNPSLVTYRDGAVEAAADFAARHASSREAGIQALCNKLKEYECPVLLPGEALRTS